jgi:hypothetical protein
MAMALPAKEMAGFVDARACHGHPTLRSMHVDTVD